MINRSEVYKPKLFWFSLFVLVCSLLLLYAGGFTTSIEAGMAFLDWPLSDGSLNPEGWTQHRMKRAEHSHRLLGMQLGILSISLFAWILLREARSWLRTLAGLTLAIIVLQGLLGGLRVKLDSLNLGTESNLVAQSLAISHACGAQIVLCLLVTITVATSRWWIEIGKTHRSAVLNGVGLFGVGACCIIYLQIVIGAVVRHGNAGLAIFTFPLSTLQGDLFPNSWNWAVVVNFAHRIGAVAATAAVLLFVAQIWISSYHRRAMASLSLIPIALVAIQFFLGAVVVWTRINEHAATLHLLFGAFLLASCWMLTFVSFRFSAGMNSSRTIAKDPPGGSENTLVTRA